MFILDEDEDEAPSFISMRVPFDLRRYLSPHLEIFGPLEDNGLVGRVARFKGGKVTLGDGEINLAPTVGLIMGECHGQVLLTILLASGPAYLGWLDPDSFELIYVHSPELNKWMN